MFCLEKNQESLKDVVLEFDTDVHASIDSFFENFTIVNNPTGDIVLGSNLNTYNYLYYYGQNARYIVS